MRLDVEFEITAMKLGGHELTVPKGLSELMNRAGAWKYIQENDHENVFVDNYDRKVIIEDGTLRTYLICKSSLNSTYIEKKEALQK